MKAYNEEIYIKLTDESKGQHGIDMGGASYRSLGYFGGTLSEITTRFGSQAHSNILLELSHPSPNIFTSNSSELGKLSWREVGSDLP